MPPSRFSSEDLVARATGALPPAEAEALDAAMRADGALRREFEQVSAHLLLYEGVASAPPPPPFHAIAARLDEAPAVALRLRARLYRLAAASVAAAAVVAVLLWSSGPGPVPRDSRVRLGIDAGQAISVRRDRAAVGEEGNGLFSRLGEAVARGDERSGDLVLATERASLRIGDRARVALDAGTTLRLVADDEVRVERGRAQFEVAHLPPSTDGRVPADAPPVAFRVRTSSVNVEVRGTKFTVEAYDSPAWREKQLVLVDVEDGVVTANDVRLGAGEQRLFVVREAVAIESKSLAVSLEAAARDEPRAGAPVDVQMVLSNPTDVPVAVPVRDGVASPIFIEVTSPTRHAIPVRVTPKMLTDADTLPKVIPPRGRLALTVRFEDSFPVAGTYRLRALFQPAAAVRSPGSGDLVLVVR